MLLPSEGLALSARTDFVSDVAEYLQRTPRQLPSRYFYDALGSALFDAICRLPWYRVTRAETALLARHAREMLEPLPRPLNITELGCGNGEKLAVLLEKGGERFRRVHLIDISPAALLSARARLATLPATPVTTFQGTYEQGLARLATHRSHGAWLVLFLGSNIGNFDPPAAREMLRRIRASLVEGDALLLGTDLVKSPRALQLAYDDPLQVTAAFNRNLLRRINDELGGTFDLDGFAHAPCGTRSTAGSRCTWSARVSSSCESRRPTSRSSSRRTSGSGRRARTSTSRSRSLVRGAARRIPGRRAVDRRGRAVRADAVSLVVVDPRSTG